MRYIIFYILFFALVTIGCKKEIVYADSLLRADQALVSGEDSVALDILLSIEDNTIDTMAYHDRALYAVLLNQALDRMDYELDDSLARVAVDYYLNTDVQDPYHEGLSYFYMGHVLKEQSDISAINWYKDAKDKFIECGNLRYEFLCWNYMGNISATRRSFNNSIPFFKNGIIVAKKAGSDYYTCAEYLALSLSYFSREDIDSSIVYLDSARAMFPIATIMDNEYYIIKANLALRDSNYYEVLLYCDSVDNNNDFRALDLKIDAFLGLKSYDDAQRLLAEHHYDDLFQEAIIYSQLSEVYKMQGKIDSALYYSEKYSSIIETIDIQENEANLVIKEYFRKKKPNGIAYIWLYVFVGSLFIALLVAGFAHWRHFKQKGEINRYEVEVNALKDEVFKHIQEIHNRQKQVDESIILIRKLIGRDIALKLQEDDSLTKSQRVKLMYYCIDKYFPKITATLIDYYGQCFTDDDDIVCIIGNAFGVTYKQIATIICKSESSVNMKLRRSPQKIEALGLIDFNTKVQEYISSILGHL
ncbi:MAG: hypothetical protein Q4C30_10010 [Bacteroidia bacterium]|nr:hypothetical protein [Bacteroidia bacterium]